MDPLFFIKVTGRKDLVKYIVGEKEENSYRALSGHCISPPISKLLNILEDRSVNLYKLHFLGKRSSSVKKGIHLQQTLLSASLLLLGGS